MEGVSFWMERSQGRRRYFLGGSDLESEPVVTREYQTAETDDGGFWTEEWEFLVQGHQGCVFLQGRKVRLKCRSLRNSGAVAFFNATRQSESEKLAWAGSAEVHFSHVSLTTLTRGPLTVSGMLANREKVLSYSVSPQEKALQDQAKSQQQEREKLPRASQSHGPGGFRKSNTQQQQHGSSFGRARPNSMPQLPKVAPAKKAQSRGLSQEELFRMTETGEARPLRLHKAASGGAGSSSPARDHSRHPIKFIPALKSMEREKRREEVKARAATTNQTPKNHRS